MSSDSDNEVKSEDEIETEEMPKQPEKKARKPRKPLDEEAKRKMLANLEKGRKKAHEIKRLKALENSKIIEDKMRKELAEADKKNVKIKENNIEDVEDIKIVKKDKPIKETKKKTKKQKIILQVDSDSSSDEEAIVIKTRSKKKKTKEITAPQLPKPPLIRTPPPQPQPKPELTPQQKALVEKNRKIEMAVNSMKNRKY